MRLIKIRLITEINSFHWFISPQIKVMRFLLLVNQVYYCIDAAMTILFNHRYQQVLFSQLWIQCSCAVRCTGGQLISWRPVICALGFQSVVHSDWTRRSELRMTGKKKISLFPIWGRTPLVLWIFMLSQKIWKEGVIDVHFFKLKTFISPRLWVLLQWSKGRYIHGSKHDLMMHT